MDLTMIVNVNGLRSPSAMASPTPSTATVKMNGSLHSRHQAFGVSRHGHGAHTPTPKAAFDLSRDNFNHSLHDTSQELSRSVLSSGPRLRTPNPIPTPIPVPNATPLTHSPTLNPSVSSTASPVRPTSAALVALPSIRNDSASSASPPSSSSSVHEILASLALLSIVSVLLAFLAILFLVKVMSLVSMDGRPGPAPGLCNLSTLNSRIVDASEYQLVYEVVVGLTTCTISLDFTCLLICCAQFIFASKLAKTPYGHERAVHYLRQSSYSRVVAVGGFFVSIPVLLTAIILYAFIQFESKSAIITSLLLGLSIVFCGLAMIHNVYVWQQEKTKATVVRTSMSIEPSTRMGAELKVRSANSVHSSNQGLDVTQNASMELSTLV